MLTEVINQLLLDSEDPTRTDNWQGVIQVMREHGIERRRRSEARTDGDVEILKDEEWLRERYICKTLKGCFSREVVTETL
jgi:hypothetical protein